MTDEELKALVAENSKAIKELRESQKETDKQLKQTDKQLKRTDAIVSHLGLGLGMLAEETHYRSLPEAMGKHHKHFDIILRNLKRKGSREYDLVAVNGEEILVVEIKYRLQKEDIDDFIHDQLPQFKSLFPDYSKYRLLGGVAGLIVFDDILQYAEKKGLYVLTQKGESSTVANKKGFIPKVF